MLWNKVVLVNVWKDKIDNTINHNCLLCGDVKELVTHKFQECGNVQKV